MVFGQIYVAVFEKIPDTQTQVFDDLQGLGKVNEYDAAFRQIEKNPRSQYNKVLERTQFAGRIDIVCYLALGLLLGLWMYFSTDEEDRTVGDFLTWPMIMAALAGLTFIGISIPALAMYSYQSTLGQLVGQCGSELGDARRACWKEYRANQVAAQSRIDAANIAADSRIEAARMMISRPRV